MSRIKDYGYKYNEWVAMYVDECGDRQVIPFNTFEDAEKFLKVCDCRIGVVTTAFYNHYIAKDDSEAVPIF